VWYQEEEEEEDHEGNHNAERERANKLDEFTFTEKDIKTIAEIVQMRQNNPVSSEHRIYTCLPQSSVLISLFSLCSLSVFSLFSRKFEFLVASLCPSIVGNHLVKAGLLLALFGGTTNDGLDEKNR